MSNIDLRKFVDIDIKTQKLSSVKTTRETVVILTALAVQEKVVSNYLEASTTFAGQTKLLSAAKTFFDCGGKQLHIVPNVEYTKSAILSAVSDLPDEEIVIVYVQNDSSSSIGLAQMFADVATTYNSTEDGIKTKLFVAPTNSLSNLAGTINMLEVQNLILKFDDSAEFKNRADLAIAAYLSKINVLVPDSIKDYCYVSEPDYLEFKTADNSTVDRSREYNINVDIRLASAVRNIGGNCTDGSDIVNSFVRIILQQTITEALINLLATHLKGSGGLTKIYSTIVKDLEKYLICGYLVTDKVWTKDDLAVNYGGSDYTIIKQGTPLTAGYVLSILPYSSLTEEDKIAHKTPPIYLILAEQYGIRTITINGEVI